MGYKVIFMSGYVDDSSVIDTINDRKLELLTKPVAPSQLMAKVREVLDRTDITH